MVYSSVIFIFYFLPVLLAVYYLLPKNISKNILLFLVSLLFYAWGEGTLIFLLLAIAFGAWFFAYIISLSKFKKLFLGLGVASFVLVLVYYKYLGFVIHNLIYTDPQQSSQFNLIMPMGVSFFVFQAISYTIDVYRKNKTVQKNPFRVALYIVMFPQLISGPLVRYRDIEDQIKNRSFDFDRFVEGIKRFIIGLGKKVLIANPLSVLVGQIMDTDTSLISTEVAWLGIFAFALQLFFDFAGYTDMAIGVGKMLGFDLPENFNFPYTSRSITDFWRRWHMTLSAWLRDYIFMPLSLSLRRWRAAGAFTAMMITFVVCGMWHGPTWNFVIWGGVQGLFLGIELVFLEKVLVRIKAAAIVYTMLVVLTGFVFIRTTDLNHAFHYLSAMFVPGNGSEFGIPVFLTNEHKTLLIIGTLLCIPWKLPQSFKTGKLHYFTRISGAILLVLVFLLSIMSATTETYNPFIYFRF